MYFTKHLLLLLCLLNIELVPPTYLFYKIYNNPKFNHFPFDSPFHFFPLTIRSWIMNHSKNNVLFYYLLSLLLNLEEILQCCIIFSDVFIFNNIFFYFNFYISIVILRWFQESHTNTIILLLINLALTNLVVIKNIFSACDHNFLSLILKDVSSTLLTDVFSNTR